jgi:flagellar basal body-associated protein FliL
VPRRARRLDEQTRVYRVRVPQIKEMRKENATMSILWIILIVVLVLALLGFFSRSYW